MVQDNPLYNDASLEKILTEFPCLKQSYGLELIESDFNRLYPDKTDIIYTEWPKVASAIISETKQRKINVKNDITDTSVQALLVLPYLFSPVSLKKNKNSG